MPTFETIAASAMPELRAVLRANHAFRAAHDHELDLLLRSAQIVTLGAKEDVIQGGAPARHVFVMAEGVVRVFLRGVDGREITLTHLVAPAVFSAKDALAAAGVYTESVRAVRPLRVVALDAAAFVAYVQSNRDACMSLLIDMSRRLVNASQRQAMPLFEVPPRLAGLLLGYVEWAGKPVADGTQIHVDLTVGDLANGLGVTRKSVTRALRDWQTAGWITRRRGWWVLRNMEQLQLLAASARVRYVEDEQK